MLNDFLHVRFASWVEELLKKAIDMGLQMNYNTEVTMLTEAEDGSFTLSTKDGRVRFPPHPTLLPHFLMQYVYNMEYLTSGLAQNLMSSLALSSCLIIRSAITIMSNCKTDKYRKRDSYD